MVRLACRRCSNAPVRGLALTLPNSADSQGNDRVLARSMGKTTFAPTVGANVLLVESAPDGYKLLSGNNGPQTRACAPDEA